jgi:hypothetical protein
MKGTLNKTEQGWVVRWAQEDPRDPKAELPLHPEYQTILPLDLDLEGKEVDFEFKYHWEEGMDQPTDVAKLIEPKSYLAISNPPPNSIILSLDREEPIIVIDEVGFKYKGELIEDAGEIYKLFKEFLKKSSI